MSMTVKQLLNNINSMEQTINRKVEACRILAKNFCFEEAQVLAVEAQIEASRLRDIWDSFDIKNAPYDEQTDE